MNIFTKENFAKYNTKSRTWGIGNWTTRNGVAAMVVTPEPFYKNNYSTSVESGMLMDEFAPNTQYVFDFWIDYDAVIYDSVYRTGGFTVVYTDGTTNASCAKTGGSGVGWQRAHFVSASGKSISHLSIYYWTNADVFYRYDCSISPVTDNNFCKSGIINTGEFKDTSSDSNIYNGGLINVSNIVEN